MVVLANEVDQRDAIGEVLMDMMVRRPACCNHDRWTALDQPPPILATRQTLRPIPHVAHTRGINWELRGLVCQSLLILCFPVSFFDLVLFV